MSQYGYFPSEFASKERVGMSQYGTVPISKIDGDKRVLKVYESLMGTLLYLKILGVFLRTCT